MEVEYHSQLEALKLDLARRHDWSDAFAYQTIDRTREGAISFNNLIAFCKSHGFRASDSEVVSIIRRIDVDADQRIGQDEFFTFMRPAEDVPRIPCELHPCQLEEQKRTPHGLREHFSPARPSCSRPEPS